jgi:hypothetical protein
MSVLIALRTYERILIKPDVGINTNICRENVVHFGSCGLIIIHIQHEAPFTPVFRVFSLF